MNWVSIIQRPHALVKVEKLIKKNLSQTIPCLNTQNPHLVGYNVCKNHCICFMKYNYYYYYQSYRFCYCPPSPLALAPPPSQLFCSCSLPPFIRYAKNGILGLLQSRAKPQALGAFQRKINARLDTQRWQPGAIQPCI